jgi:hypothetical protein
MVFLGQNMVESWIFGAKHPDFSTIFDRRNLCNACSNSCMKANEERLQSWHNGAGTMGLV